MSLDMGEYTVYFVANMFLNHSNITEQTEVFPCVLSLAQDI